MVPPLYAAAAGSPQSISDWLSYRPPMQGPSRLLPPAPIWLVKKPRRFSLSQLLFTFPHCW